MSHPWPRDSPLNYCEEATYRAILSHPVLPRPLVRDRIVLLRDVPVEVVLR